MATIYDFILDLNANTANRLADIGARLSLDRICVCQLFDTQQVLKHTWPLSTGSNPFIEMSLVDLPHIHSRLRSLIPFFDPLETLPEQQTTLLHNRGVKAAIFIPLQYEGRLWGFLGCLCTTANREWRSSEISLLLQESINLTYDILLSETLVELKESDENLRYMLDYLTEGIVTIDENSLVTNISGFIAQLGGYHQDEIIGRNIEAFIHRDDWDRLHANLARSRDHAGERIIDDYRLLLKTGEIFWCRITTTPLFRHGVHKGFTCLLFRIDEFRRTDEHLHDLNTLLRQTSDLAWITDLELYFTYVSPSVEYLLGYTPEEALRLNAGLTLSRKSLDRLAQAFTEGLQAIHRGDLAWKSVLPVEQFHRKGAKLNGTLCLTIRQDREGKPNGFIGITHYHLRNPFAL